MSCVYVYSAEMEDTTQPFSIVPIEVTAAVPQYFSPYYDTDNKSQPIGFSIEVMDKIAKIAGIQVNYQVQSTWDDAVEALKRGEVDLIPLLVITPERSFTMEFTSVLESNPVRVYIRRATGSIVTLENLDNRLVGAIRNHSAVEMLQARKQIHIRLFSSYPEAMLALLRNEVDAFAFHESAIQILAEKTGMEDKILALEEPLGEARWAIGIRRGNKDLRNRLDAALLDFKSSPAFLEIHNKWFNWENEWNFEDILPSVGLLLIVTIVIMSLWRYISLYKVTIKLRESENRFRMAFQHASIGRILYTPEGKILEVNQSICQSLGYTEEELKNMTVWEATHPDDREIFHAHIHQLLNEGLEVVHVEKRHIHKNGQNVWSQVSRQLIRDFKGKPLYINSDLVDISDYKNVIEELKQERANIQRYLDIVRVIILVLNRLGEIVLINREGQRILGYKEEELLGKNWFDFCLPDRDKNRLHTLFHKIINGKSGFLDYYENPIQTHQGEERLIAWHNQILQDSGGQFIGIICSGEDITNVRQVVEDKEKLQQQFLQAQKMESIGRLAGGVAHDFNNILTAILGYCSLSKSAVDPEDTLNEYLDEIEKAGERAASLTRQLLAFSRKEIILTKIVDLNKIFLDMDKMLNRLIGEDIDMKFIPSPVPAMVKADPGQLEQVLLNLIVNARDAMPEGGKVTIETAILELDTQYAATHHNVEESLYVMLAVSDTGCGMNKEIQTKVFEPFFTTKEQGKGTGLGLSTVYGIVKQSGGHIFLYSEEGKGTTFKVYFPLHREKVRPRNVESEIVNSFHGSECLLLVEDEESVRNMISRVLKQYGYTVLCAAIGSEAIAIAQSYPDTIHLLITDVVLPQMSGVEIAERISSLRPSVSVLYMSGYTDNAIIRNALLREGVNFVQKPFKSDVFLKKIQEALRQTTVEE